MLTKSPLAAASPLFGRRAASRGVIGYTAVLAVVATCLFAAAAAAQTFGVLKTFDIPGSPAAGLLQATDGNLYGTTASGGAGSCYPYGCGTIFKIDANGSTFTTLHSFAGNDGATPQASLVQATDGSLYGTTANGGANGSGTIFKIDTSGTALTTLHSFAGNDGATPQASLVQGTDGSLYGTTAFGGASDYGTIFKIDTNGTTFTTLHSFTGSDGSAPYAGLIQGTDGNLYGTTVYGGGTCSGGCGTIFKINTNGTGFTTLHSFVNGDGAYPYAGLVQGTDGNLYGTTASGGAGSCYPYGCGTIFKIKTKGTGFTTLHNFAGSPSDGGSPQAGLIQGTDGKLYGTTADGGASYGTIFKIAANGTTFTTVHSFTGSDGSGPYGGLIQDTDGNLYGTTVSGGASYGTIFKIASDGSTFTTLHTFVSSGGVSPYAGLTQARDGNLYGSAAFGGASGNGTIFKIAANGTTFTTVHSFAGGDGAYPEAGLIQGTDGNLYGTTAFGGASDYGTIFKIDTNGTTFTTLHSFAGSDGAYPYNAGLIQGTDGNLYGTTFDGGGTIFKIDTSGTTFTTLHSFTGSDGSGPYGGLIQGADGNLYGTTYSGGASGNGTIFKIDPAGATFTTLHSFTGSDGASTLAGLLQGTDGNLYGTTGNGGAGSCPAGCGTIFKIDTAGTTFTTVHSFARSDGSGPTARLIQATDGNLYGTTPYDGANGGGTIFQIDTSGTALTTLHSFAGNDGAIPQASLVQGTDGNFYGTTSAGGPSHGGVVFRFGLGCFFDVLPTDPFSSFICTVARDGITAGCGNGDYCRGDSITRAQMAVFLLRAEHGSGYNPPACAGIFTDVACPEAFAVNWIEQLDREGITAGCGGGNYCPGDPVTRAEMAVFLLRAQHGSGYLPPTCHGIFGDVPCPGGFGVDWIEQLDQEGIAGGCQANPPLYCPDDPSTRAQMAVFLVTTFGL